MNVRTSLMKIFSLRSAALLAGLSLAAGQASAQQSTTFEDLGYGGATTACDWDGGDLMGNYSGFSFFGLRPLDLANYQKCWATSNTPLQQNYYAKTGVVALGTGNSLIQRNFGAGSKSFVLQQLGMGSGWTAPVTITMRAGSFINGSAVQSFTRSWDLTGTYSLLTGLPTQAIDYFYLDVDWNLELMQSNVTAFDPFASRVRRNEAGAIDGKPYLTYYVDNMLVTTSTVPEPSTYALMGAGLLALGVASRRRRKQG